jgi:ribosomal-protein-serine acetyltransferase
MFATPLREDFELRLLEEHHAFELFASVERNRDHLRQWLPWVDVTRSEDDGIAFIRSTLEMFAAHDGFTAGIWHRDRVAGVIGTHRIDWRNRRVELGYWLAREFEGRGIITDACRMAITHLFREMDLNRVEIRCADGNAKSSAIPRRLGFKLEGTLRDAQLVNGRYHDLLVFGMLKSEWT